MKEVNISEQPIMYVNLSGNLPAAQLKKFADDFQDKIEALPEITRVDIVGALDQQVNVDVDLNKLQASQPELQRYLAVPSRAKTSPCRAVPSTWAGRSGPCAWPASTCAPPTLPTFS
ncbi:MAG: hypothetical protein WKG07_14750 [Hymenobacter sp.]